MNNPLVSVIIATYNHSKLLMERALESIRAQTYKNLVMAVLIKLKKKS